MIKSKYTVSVLSNHGRMSETRAWWVLVRAYQGKL